MIEFLGIEVSQQDVLIGLSTGLVYAAIAAGFVLIYRSSGILNFAHAELGAFCAAIFVVLNVLYGIPWWFAFALTLAAGAAIAAVIEMVFIRRLFESPRLVLLIATIGISQLLVVFKINLPQVVAPGGIPLPFDFSVKRPTDDLRILPRDVLVFVVVPVLIVALTIFLTKTRFGMAVRASASNADSARTFGISVRRTSTIVWAISGILAAATGILYAILQNINAARAGTESLAPPLLLRVLVVALIARMRSLPLTLAAGLGVGLAEQIVRGNVPSTDRSIVDMYFFVAVLIAVIFVSRRRRDRETWSLSPRIKAIPSQLQHIWVVRHLPHIGFVLVFGALALIPVLAEANSTMFLWTRVVAFAICALSLTMLTGWGGQLSLAQFAFVGLGGLTLAAVTAGHDIPLPFDVADWSVNLPWGVGLIIGTAAGVLVALAIGLPSLRVRGLFLAVATLGFAVAASNWLFIQDFFTGGSSALRAVDKPSLWGIDLGASRKSYYYFCLICLAVAALVVARLRKTGIGRSMIAVRENEEAAEASTVSSRRMKLTAFAVSGGIAAFAGCLYVTLQPSVQTATAFTPRESLDMVAIAVIGGLGSIAGPILGTLWVKGIPALFGTNPSDQVTLLTSSIGLLILLMYVPGGLIQLVYSVRDAFLNLVMRRGRRRAKAPPQPAVAKEVPTRHTRKAPALASGQPWLATKGATVNFGGNIAVREVDFAVHQGELVGLIGTNGAGKSTLMNAISGFVPSKGSIEVLGREVSHMSATQRHRLGLGRGFQAATLYPDLTVRETIMVALEARERSLLLPSMTALPPSPQAERRKAAEADELIDYLGLGRYADHFIATLSTGTRRIVELGGLLAVDAKVLMLDEPTGGVAQREAEAFGPLIKRIQAELDAAVVVIEHDMPLVMSISDRVYCLEAGEIIAAGSPDEVRSDPAVIASYLGTDIRAIERSGVRQDGVGQDGASQDEGTEV